MTPEKYSISVHPSVGPPGREPPKTSHTILVGKTGPSEPLSTILSLTTLIKLPQSQDGPRPWGDSLQVAGYVFLDSYQEEERTDPIMVMN